MSFVVDDSSGLMSSMAATVASGYSSSLVCGVPSSLPSNCCCRRSISSSRVQLDMKTEDMIRDDSIDCSIQKMIPLDWRCTLIFFLLKRGQVQSYSLFVLIHLVVDVDIFRKSSSITISRTLKRYHKSRRMITSTAKFKKMVQIGHILIRSEILA